MNIFAYDRERRYSVGTLVYTLPHMLMVSVIMITSVSIMGVMISQIFAVKPVFLDK